MTKLSDLTNVRPLPAPRIRGPWVSQSRWSGERKPELLHIVDRAGDIGKKPLSFFVTRCNRVFDWWENRSGRVESAIRFPFPEGSYKLCPRCGNPDDFREVVVERERLSEQVERERKDKEARQDEARRKYLFRANTEWLHLLNVIKTDGNLLIQGDEDEDGYYIRIAGGEFYFHLERYPHFADNLESIHDRVEKEVG